MVCRTDRRCAASLACLLGGQVERPTSLDALESSLADRFERVVVGEPYVGPPHVIGRARVHRCGHRSLSSGVTGRQRTSTSGKR